MGVLAKRLVRESINRVEHFEDEANEINDSFEHFEKIQAFLEFEYIQKQLEITHL